MSSQYIGQNIYTIFHVSKTASYDEIKKAYRKLVLLIHPDRNKSDTAHQDMVYLTKIMEVLKDEDRRKLYDETGEIEETEFSIEEVNNWRNMYKKVTGEDIKIYEKKYIGSQEERDDIINTFIQYNGKVKYLLEAVLFSQPEDLPRFYNIIDEAIKNGEIKDYKRYQTDKKKDISFWKNNDEAEEATELANKLGINTTESLHMAITKRRTDNPFDDIMAKYANIEKGSKSKKKKANEYEIDDAAFEKLQSKITKK